MFIAIRRERLAFKNWYFRFSIGLVLESLYHLIATCWCMYDFIDKSIDREREGKREKEFNGTMHIDTTTNNF